MKYGVELGVLLIFIIFGAIFVANSFNPEYEFSGSDGQGGDQVNATYYAATGEPYDESAVATPFWEPPSGEIESLLFVVQASIGAIIIGYFLGYYSRRHQLNQR